MLDLIVVDGRARGIVARDLVTGEISTHFADAVVLATGGYGNVFYLSTNAMGCNVTATWRAHKRGAYFANPCYTQIHPTCIPVSGDYQSKLTLMSESLRNDGRVWVPKERGDDRRPADEIPEDDRDYYLERHVPGFGNLVPRDIASRAAKNVCDDGRGVGPGGLGVYLDFGDAIERLGRQRSRRSTATSSTCTRGSRARTPTRRRCASTPPSTTRWAGCGSTTTCSRPSPACSSIGEANFSDHGANRLGASALMQGLADGYFVLPSTITNYLRRAARSRRSTTSHPAAVEAVHERQGRRSQKLLSIKGNRTPDSFHRELGQLDVGALRHGAHATRACARRSSASRSCARSSGATSRCSATATRSTRALENAGRVADFLELGELMCVDALNRARELRRPLPRGEPDRRGRGDARRRELPLRRGLGVDAGGPPPVLHKEALEFEYVHPRQRSYK